MRLSQDCRDHCFNIGHDLGANAFFVALAVASRPLGHEGLYHWVGEERCRRLLREDAGPRHAPAPDGWGRYLLVGDREITFFLEWDRGTESVDRLHRKSANYIRYFARRRGANYAHVLFVFPSSAKEIAYHESIAEDLPRDELCCVFWTTTLKHLELASPRGPIWWKVERRPPSEDDARGMRSRRSGAWLAAASRVSLDGLASQPGYGLVGAETFWRAGLTRGEHKRRQSMGAPAEADW